MKVKTNIQISLNIFYNKVIVLKNDIIDTEVEYFISDYSLNNFPIDFLNVSKPINVFKMRNKNNRDSNCNLCTVDNHHNLMKTIKILKTIPDIHINKDSHLRSNYFFFFENVRNGYVDSDVRFDVNLDNGSVYLKAVLTVRIGIVRNLINNDVGILDKTNYSECF